MFNFNESGAKIKVPIFSPFRVCIDMGTSTTKIAILSKGFVLKEATYLGLNTKDHSYIFFGDEAKLIIGKTPEFIKIKRPVINGVIIDFDAQVSLIRKYIEKSVFPYLRNYLFLRPPMEAIASVPFVSTEIEKKAVEEVLYKVGFSEVFLIEKPLANAASLKMNMFSHHPIMIVDLGGGLVEMAIISGGGIVSEKTLKNAGDSLNRSIANYVYLKNGIILGENTCEELKINLMNFVNDEKTIIVRGKSLENGLPKSIRLKSSDIREALITPFNQILDATKEMIEASPPEVVDEIYKTGLILTGGLSSIKGIDRFFAKELKMDVILNENSENSTIYGLLNASKHKKDLRKLIIPKI